MLLLLGTKGAADAAAASLLLPVVLADDFVIPLLLLLPEPRCVLLLLALLSFTLLSPAVFPAAGPGADFPGLKRDLPLAAVEACAEAEAEAGTLLGKPSG